MRVLADPMVSVATLAVRVNMDGHSAQVRKVMQQLVTDLPCNLVSLGHR